jgi:hypothetical protein
MKAELASQSGFCLMPEKYFQVRCEEDADGKYYTKIGRYLVHYNLCMHSTCPSHSPLLFFYCASAIVDGRGLVCLDWRKLLIGSNNSHKDECNSRIDIR